MTGLILHATSGELYCKDTKQKFGEHYYTFSQESSSLVTLLRHKGVNAKKEVRAGLEEIGAAFDNVDMVMLKALLNGDTFPGSGIKTRSVWKNQSPHIIADWKRSFPELFAEKKAFVADPILDAVDTHPTLTPAQIKAKAKEQKRLEVAAAKVAAEALKEAQVDDGFGEV